MRSIAALLMLLLAGCGYDSIDAKLEEVSAEQGHKMSFAEMQGVIDKANQRTEFVHQQMTEQEPGSRQGK